MRSAFSAMGRVWISSESQFFVVVVRAPMTANAIAAAKST
jgi:hypothetical protein